MAYEYAFVHLTFTIPAAVLLTLASRPILNQVHYAQIATLVFLAFFSTLPWDAYLIRRNVWSYPPHVVIGPRLIGIPVEELFFFVIQTYITSLLYILCNKPLLHVLFLRGQRNRPRWATGLKLAGQAACMSMALYGAHLVQLGGRGTYLGLILVWAPPFALLTWSMAGHFITSLPWFATVVPIALPTAYLWMVDELALGRGTWTIEPGTKFGVRLFGALEIEEAVFFLATNTLIVFGMAAFDQYLAVIDAFPALFPTPPRLPSPLLLAQSRLLDSGRYDYERLDGIRDATERLKKKSRSFYLASAAFSGRLRIDLILLYSFCRLADDLVDGADSTADMKAWTDKLTRFLDLCYSNKTVSPAGTLTSGRTITSTTTAPGSHLLRPDIARYIDDAFPPFARPPLRLLPTAALPSKPLYLLLEGFRTDARFDSDADADADADVGSGGPTATPPGTGTPGNSGGGGKKHFPITDEERLQQYSRCVAGTVGELCVALIAHHCQDPGVAAADEDYPDDAADDGGSALRSQPGRLKGLREAACEMGTALQYVNIARDIGVDAAMGRVYLPTTWLAEEGLTPEMVLEHHLRRRRRRCHHHHHNHQYPAAGITRPGRGEEGKGREEEQEEEEGEARQQRKTEDKLERLRRRLLDRAFALYRGARPAMADLPAGARAPMMAAVENYMEIGRVLLEGGERHGGGRATVPMLRRLGTAVTALYMG